ncbi:MAG: internal scaffolding protein [Arizlama microvirus]|nr:MAG: internal scaffolding protein [Arizlama microvirus]
MKFATAYTLKEEREKAWATDNKEPTMTQKADASETDINVIMAKYQKTGQLPKVLTTPLFGDFTNAPDYREAVEAVNAANEAFMEIPAKIRMRFGNDPGEFMKFASDPANRDELSKLGLTREPPKPTLEETNGATLREIRDALKPTEEKPNGK